tara:strand:+ start:28 stop:501 length:474 start_codon:yes stop_codon:yes gene_type:complete
LGLQEPLLLGIGHGGKLLCCSLAHLGFPLRLELEQHCLDGLAQESVSAKPYGSYTALAQLIFHELPLCASILYPPLSVGEIDLNNAVACLDVDTALCPVDTEKLQLRKSMTDNLPVRDIWLGRDIDIKDWKFEVHFDTPLLGKRYRHRLQRKPSNNT